tara:strand:- start:19 stop:603 length:585 start_codon:yes stop_codon:yes gene_type:complete
MRITIDKLKQIINEEVQQTLNEQTPQDKCKIKFTAICNKEVAQKREAYDKTKPKDEFGDYPFKPSCKETGGKAPCVDDECIQNPELCFKKCFEPKYAKCMKGDGSAEKADKKTADRIAKAKEAEKAAGKKTEKDSASPKGPEKKKEADDFPERCKSTKDCRKFGKGYSCNKEFTKKYKGKLYGYCVKVAEFSGD